MLNLLLAPASFPRPEYALSEAHALNHLKLLWNLLPCRACLSILSTEGFASSRDLGRGRNPAYEITQSFLKKS